MGCPKPSRGSNVVCYHLFLIFIPVLFLLRDIQTHERQSFIYILKNSIHCLMIIDVRLLAELNLIVQLVLAVGLLFAFRLALARDFKRHCALMRFAVPVQILAILGVMLPSMYGYFRNPSTDPLLHFEILIHHTLGLMVVALWTYINLIFMNILKPKVRLKFMMRLALGCWAASMVLGLYLYWAVYSG